MANIIVSAFPAHLNFVTFPRELAMPVSKIKDIVEIAKLCAETLGFTFAGLFFLWKFISGYLVSNLSLAVRCQRSAINGDLDALVITTSLKKGDRNSILLHDAQARLRFGETTKTKTFEDVERRGRTKLKKPKRWMILWDKRSEKAPFLCLSPGEETEFSVFFEVPKSSICVVDVAVLGTRRYSGKFGQWRASSICMPRAAQARPGKSEAPSTLTLPSV